jgi:hypothetical protein
MIMAGVLFAIVATVLVLWLPKFVMIHLGETSTASAARGPIRAASL